MNYGGGLLSAPVTTLEGALLETEGLGSKTLSVNENVQNLAAGIFQVSVIIVTFLHFQHFCGVEVGKFNPYRFSICL